jgi:hypothetical protein
MEGTKQRTTSHDLDRQLGLTTLLREAEATNQARRFEQATAHLPATMREGIAHYRGLLRRHHAAVLAGDEAGAKRLQEEARLLALKLNGGERGYLADENAPGCILQRRTAARSGKVPLWGQFGSFLVEACGMRVRIETRGLYGVCGYGSFNAHAVDLDRPFLSETGFRSFLGYGPCGVPGLTVDAYVRRVIEGHVQAELRGRLLPIAPHYCRQEG